MSGLEILIGKKLALIIANKFGAKVIERWTRFRAEKFFEGFVESLTKEQKTGNLEPGTLLARLANAIFFCSTYSKPMKRCIYLLADLRY